MIKALFDRIRPRSFQPAAVYVLALGLVYTGLLPVIGQSPITRKTRPVRRPKPSKHLDKKGGFVHLVHQLGSDAPIGIGIVAGHVEGQRGDYLPNAKHRDLTGVSIIGRSGTGLPNAHATTTARIIYGPRGLAPGIRQVHCFSIDDFLTSAVLKAGSSEPPDAIGIRLFNHSWIGHGGRRLIEILRRVDYLIDRYDTMMVVGVDNDRTSKVPALLGSAHNAIAVGHWTGDSSGGYTQFDTKHRCKPDLVAPGTNTSMATAVVTAAVARLLETVDRFDDPGPASHSEVLKAVLLAGADKASTWKPAPGKPLDERLGAGRLNISKTHAILTARPSKPLRLDNPYGWHFERMSPNMQLVYEFDLPQTSGPASLVLVWNRQVIGGRLRRPGSRSTAWYPVPRMADLDLDLIRVDDQDIQHRHASSQSRVDNVEHLFLRSLTPGRYHVVVRRRDEHMAAWDYALAWRIEKNSPTAVHR